jgi:hypothetical protein
MKLLRFALPLALGMVIGYGASGTSAQTLNRTVPFFPGEKLTIAFDPNAGGQSCTVIAVSGDFVGCKGENESGTFTNSTDHWFNIRTVARIDRGGQR